MTVGGPLRILHLTAGTGRWYCGTCIRDEALVSAWQQQGHDAQLVPLYLPVVGDHPEPTALPRVQMGGVGTWAHHALPLLGRLPPWACAPLDSAPVLSLAGRFAGATEPAALGALTVDMLRGLDGHQASRIDQLLASLRRRPPPDVVVLSNSLLAGLLPALRRGLGAPVVVTIQGEHHFLDALGDHADQAWALVARHLRSANAIVAVSASAAHATASRARVPQSRITVVPNGVEASGFGPPAPPAIPTLGYVARLAPHKGLHAVVAAWRQLIDGGEELRLVLAGTLQPGDAPGVRTLERQLAADGLAHRVQILPNLSPVSKREVLRRLTVASVAPQRDDAGALYALEAAASGVPFVGPDRGALGEWVRATGAGVLVPSDDPNALAPAIRALLHDPARRADLSARGQEAVRAHHTAAHMAQRELRVLLEVVRPQAA